jgi:hypothetical protein
VKTAAAALAAKEISKIKAEYHKKEMAAVHRLANTGEKAFGAGAAAVDSFLLPKAHVTVPILG